MHQLIINTLNEARMLPKLKYVDSCLLLLFRHLHIGRSIRYIGYSYVTHPLSSDASMDGVTAGFLDLRS